MHEEKSSIPILQFAQMLIDAHVFGHNKLQVKEYKYVPLGTDTFDECEIRDIVCDVQFDVETGTIKLFTGEIDNKSDHFRVVEIATQVAVDLQKHVSGFKTLEEFKAFFKI